jgi:hypothetical protein
MKIIGLVGEPAAGKSTVMRGLIETLGEGRVQKESLVCYTVFPEDKVYIAGIYDEAVFSGTDRTSKGCGPQYREWLARKCADVSFKDWTFYFEGERFSNSKFFDFFFEPGSVCNDVTIYFLNADPELLNQRNADRSNQNPAWRKGMATRMRKLRENYPVQVVEQGFSLAGAGE